TASETSRIASETGRDAGSASGPNNAGNIARQAAASVDSPFIAARARTRCSSVAVSSSSAARPTSGVAWTPAYTIARASGAASWNLTTGSGPLAERDERDLGQRREPVDRPV